MYIFEHVTFSDMQIVVLLIIQLKLQFNHGQNVLEYRYLAHFCFISNDFDQRFFASVTEMSLKFLLLTVHDEDAS